MLMNNDIHTKACNERRRMRIPLPCMSSQVFHYRVCRLKYSTTVYVVSSIPLPCMSSQVFHYRVCRLKYSTTVYVVSSIPLPCMSSQVLQVIYSTLRFVTVFTERRCIVSLCPGIEFMTYLYKIICLLVSTGTSMQSVTEASWLANIVCACKQ